MRSRCWFYYEERGEALDERNASCRGKEHGTDGLRTRKLLPIAPLRIYDERVVSGMVGTCDAIM